MSDGKMDEMKGKLKEGVGSLTGNDEMKDEGREDQAKGKMKQAGDKVGDAAEDVKDSLTK